MKIDHLLQRTKAQDPQKNQLLETAKETAKNAKAAKDGAPKVDTVTISEQARSLQRTQSDVKTGGETQQSRQDRIAQIKAQIASGDYKVDDKLVEGTADAILKSGAVSDLVNAEHPLSRARLAESGALESDPDKLAQVKQRIDSGYYNSSDVTDTIAERMLEDLLG
jgi:flagellar biosynthesis anti-sigma factor FlgM